MVAEARNNLIYGNVAKKVAIQMDHIKTGDKLILPLFSVDKRSDTTLVVNDYRPVIKTLYDVERPEGYLIQKKMTEIVEWAKRQNLVMTSFNDSSGKKARQYFISQIDSIDFEGDIIINPITELKEALEKINEEEYLFITTNQLKNSLIVIALEPK